MNIFFCLHRKHHSGCYKISTDYWASDICQQVLWQFYHIMLYVNKPQMLVWIRTPPLFDFQEMIFTLTSKIKRSASISINVYLHFSRKGEFSFLKKMRIILKMSFRISCCYYMFYICWGSLFPVYFVFPCPCYSCTFLNIYFIDLESLWNYHKPSQADEFKTRTMFIFLTIFLNKCWNSRWTKKYENAALEAHHCNYNS